MRGSGGPVGVLTIEEQGNKVCRETDGLTVCSCRPTECSSPIRSVCRYKGPVGVESGVCTSVALSRVFIEESITGLSHSL